MPETQGGAQQRTIEAYKLHFMDAMNLTIWPFSLLFIFLFSLNIRGETKNCKPWVDLQKVSLSGGIYHIRFPNSRQISVAGHFHGNARDAVVRVANVLLKNYGNSQFIESIENIVSDDDMGNRLVTQDSRFIYKYLEKKLQNKRIHTVLLENDSEEFVQNLHYAKLNLIDLSGEFTKRKISDPRLLNNLMFVFMGGTRLLYLQKPSLFKFTKLTYAEGKAKKMVRKNHKLSSKNLFSIRDRIVAVARSKNISPSVINKIADTWNKDLIDYYTEILESWDVAVKDAANAVPVVIREEFINALLLTKNDSKVEDTLKENCIRIIKQIITFDTIALYVSGEKKEINRLREYSWLIGIDMD